MNLEKRLKAFLDSNGIQYAVGRQSFITNCVSPACGKERHMYVRKMDGQSICFKCGSKWHWKRLISRISGCSFDQAYNVLHGRGAGDVLDQGTPLDPNLFDNSNEREAKRNLGSPIVLGPDFIPWHKSGKAMEYLNFRGVTNVSILNRFEVRYHAAMNAVVFPVEEDGKIYGWQARKINPKEDEPKAITMPGFDKSKFLMGYDFIYTFPTAFFSSKIAIVEGPFDLLHIDSVDVSAVALMGKTISQDQLKLILDSGAEEIYIGLDEDATDQVYEIINHIGLKKKCFRIKPPTGKDFGDCSPEEVQKSMDDALLTSSVFLEVYLKNA